MLFPVILLDLKGGSWQQSGGLSQPTWLFRRKASPTRGARKKEQVERLAPFFN